MRTHRLRDGILFGVFTALLIVAGRGCGGSSGPRSIQLSGLVPPRATVQAIVTPSYSGVMPVTITQMSPAGGVVTLPLPDPLPQGFTGELRVGVGVFDSRRCLLSYGSGGGFHARRLLPRPPLSLVREAYAAELFTVEMRTLPSADCRGRTVIVAEVSPTMPRPQQALTLYGYGFRAESKVFLNGQPAGLTTFYSASEITVQPAAALTAGRLSVRVVNPDNTEDTREDLATVTIP